MRRLSLLCSAVLLCPGLAFAQVCSVDAQGQPVAAAAAPPAAAAAPQVLPTSGENRNVYPVIGRDEIARSPALSRIASRGATLLDLGTEDGIKIVFAYNGEQIDVFHVSQNGRFAVRSGRLLDMAEPDPAKRDLTTRRASIIPGVMPSVDVRGQAQAQGEPAEQVDGNKVLAQLATSDFGVVGRPDAPRLYMFIDPLCAFSVRAIEALRPHIAAGRVQVALIPIGIIDHETQGRSSPAAATLLGRPPGEMNAAWRGIVEAARAKRPDAFNVTEEGQTKLEKNKALAASLHVQATPTLVWRQADGQPRAQMGAQDLEAVLASFGGRQ